MGQTFKLNDMGNPNLNPRNVKTNRLAHLSAALVMALSQIAFAASGKFQFVSGDVRVQSKTGELKAVVKGTEVSQGDVIISGVPALAQLRMDDGGILVVRPNTRLTIAAYQFKGSEDGSERATYRLDRGSVRAITGQIGNTHKGNYLIQTPIASIGVRGTDHEPAYIPKDDESYLGVPPGTYDKVNTGETYIETKAGLVVIKPNSVGYAENESSVPTILPSMPNFYNKFAKKTQDAATAAAVPAPNNFSASLLATQGVAGAAIQRPIYTDNGVNLSGVNIVAPNNDNVSPTLAVFTDAKQNTGFSQIEQTRNLNFDFSRAALVDTGADSALGVNWGRWNDGFIIDGKDPRGSLHFVNTSNLTTPTQLSAMLPITAAYSFVGGTRPTDELGRVGDLTAISANINFATQKISGYSLSANNSGRAWEAQGSGTFGQFLSSNDGLRLDGLCTGCRSDGLGNPVTSTANGFAKGAFVGSKAQGLITTYGLQANEKGISGVAVLKRP